MILYETFSQQTNEEIQAEINRLKNQLHLYCRQVTDRVAELNTILRMRERKGQAK